MASTARPTAAAQFAELRLDSVLEASTHDAVTHGVDGRVGVPQPHGVRVQVPQQDADARQLLERHEVQANAQGVYRQPRDGEQQRHDEEHARHLAATGELGARVLRLGGARAGVERRVAAPQVGGDAQVADADECDWRGVQEREQHEVVGVLQRRRLPLFDACAYRHRDDRLDDPFAPHEHARDDGGRRSQPYGADHLADARAAHERSRSKRTTDGVEPFGADDRQREDARRH